jgi:hypothetical protein
MSLEMETSSDDDDLNLTLTIARNVYATMRCQESGSIAIAFEMASSRLCLNSGYMQTPLLDLENHFNFES